MKPLIVLIVVFFIALISIKLTTKNFDYNFAGIIAFASMLLFTGIGHFAYTNGMAAMIPNFISFKREIILITGIMEIVFAIGLFLPNHKNIIGWALIVFLLMILPANIKAAIENINFQSGETNGPGENYLWFRIPLQIFFIFWVYIIAIRK